jgi:GNAT superfamily N-acetyltransferase
MRPIINMLVELDNFTADASALESAAADAQLTLVADRGGPPDVLSWIDATFGGSWSQEAQAGWNWFARDAQGNCRGFATYEQRTLRYWWLAAWVEKADVGFFGPMGIDPLLRGKGVGSVLTQRALLSLKQLGFRQALIPAVGPVGFYERCCGARVVQRLDR